MPTIEERESARREYARSIATQVQTAWPLQAYNLRDAQLLRSQFSSYLIPGDLQGCECRGCDTQRRIFVQLWDEAAQEDLERRSGLTPLTASTWRRRYASACGCELHEPTEESEGLTECESCERCDVCCRCIDACRTRGCSNRQRCDCCASNRNCSECCGCWTCSYCSSRRTQDDACCYNCDRCDDCCECRTCVECDERRGRRAVCGDCERCDSCGCDCDGESDGDRDSSGYSDRNGNRIYYFTGSLVPVTSRRTEFRNNPVRRLIGTELEVCNPADYPHIRDMVKSYNGSIVHDGSVSAGGFEINLPPADGDRYLKMVQAVADSLKAGGSKADPTCGYHCHVDARDLKFWEMRRVIALYAKVEDGLFSIIAPSRRNSGYCRPCGPQLLSVDLLKAKKTTEVKDAIHNQQYGTTEKRVLATAKKNKYNDARYNALNVHSWFYRGTLEFRHHHGTVNAAKIAGWGMLCAAIVDKGSKMTERQIDEWPSGVEGLVKIAPTEGVARWVRERAVKFDPRKLAPTKDNEPDAEDLGNPRARSILASNY